MSMETGITQIRESSISHSKALQKVMTEYGEMSKMDVP